MSQYSIAQEALGAPKTPGLGPKPEALLCIFAHAGEYLKLRLLPRMWQKGMPQATCVGKNQSRDRV